MEMAITQPICVRNAKFLCLNNIEFNLPHGEMGRRKPEIGGKENNNKTAVF